MNMHIIDVNMGIFIFLTNKLKREFCLKPLLISSSKTSIHMHNLPFNTKMMCAVTEKC